MSKRKNIKRNKFLFLSIIFVVLAVSSWFAYSKMLKPIDVNVIATTGSDVTVAKPFPLGSPEKNKMCTQMAGSCITKSGQCSGYTDGCIKSDICAQPYQECSLTQPSPSPSPTPSFVSTQCYPQIASISMKNRCSDIGFSSASYACTNGSATTIPEGNCLNAMDIYDKVVIICGTICQDKI
jgi:hypothetical protein